MEHHISAFSLEIWIESALDGAGIKCLAVEPPGHEVLKEYQWRILSWVRAWRGIDAAERWRWGAVSDLFYVAAYGLSPFFRSFSLYKLEIAFARHKVGEGVNMKVF